MPDIPSMMAAEKPPERDDIGYVLGWFCGGALALGVVMAVVYLVKGSMRRAFQAVVLPVTELAWLGSMLALGLWAEHNHQLQELCHGCDRLVEGIAMVGFFGGVALFPILGVYVLRKIAWPPARKVT